MLPQHNRNFSGSGQQNQPGLVYGFEAYSTPTVPSNSHVSGAGQKQDLPMDDGDVAMEDADPYNRTKYPSRPTHSQRPSGQFLSTADESSAARKYSPMSTALSPTSPYPGSPPQHAGHSNFHAYSQNSSARQSPTRPNLYSSPSQQYYANGEYLELFGRIRW
jgi:dual specificity protein kinase YAK1